MKFLLSAIVLAFLAGGSAAQAMVTVDGNVFYFSDNFTTSTTATYTRTIWDAALSMNITKKGQVMIGWDYNSATFDDNVNSVTTTVAVTGMGPKLSFYFDKDLEWGLGFTYDLILNATQSGGSSFTYRGSGMKVDLGYTAKMSESTFLGIKMNYYSATFSEQITNQTTLTNVSYGRTAIYPSLSFTFRWE